MSPALRSQRNLAPLPCPAYLLAGGQSRRFGSDKARVIIQSQPLILRLREQLEACGHATYVVADRGDRFADFGFECLVDTMPDAGPLAGLVAALQHCQQTRRDGWLLLLSCDLVSWRRVWFEELWATASKLQMQESGVDRHPIQAVAYRTEKLQPLPALYHVSALSQAAQQLNAGRLSLVELLGKLPLRELNTSQDPRNYAFNDQAQFLQACHLDEQDSAATQPRKLVALPDDLPGNDARQ